MIISITNIRKGLYIRFNNDIFKIKEFLHVKPGKGSPFVRTKIKSLTNGKVLSTTFSSGKKIENIIVESRKCKYIYKDNNSFYFMDNINYNQIEITKKFITEEKFLTEGLEVIVNFQKENEFPLNFELPININLKVIYTEPGIKGNTTTSSNKQATLENGMIIKVPLFINTGEYIKLNTENSSYIERIKL